MARISSVLVAAVAAFALIACAQADVYSDNVKAFNFAIRKYPEYSIFAQYYGNYMNNSQVQKFMHNPALIFVPSNNAIKAAGALEHQPLASTIKYVGFHAVLFPKGKAPLGAKGLVNLKAGVTMTTQEGGVITKMTAPSKVPVKIRGKKPAVAQVVNMNLFTSSTLNAMGVDAIMTPSDM